MWESIREKAECIILSLSGRNLYLQTATFQETEVTVYFFIEHSLLDKYFQKSYTNNSNDS